MPMLFYLADRDLALSYMIDACNELSITGLKKASLEIDFDFNGSTEEIDVLVSSHEESPFDSITKA